MWMRLTRRSDRLLVLLFLLFIVDCLGVLVGGFPWYKFEHFDNNSDGVTFLLYIFHTTSFIH